MSRTVKEIQADIDEINRIHPSRQSWQERRELHELLREMDLALNPSKDPFIRALEETRERP